MKPARISDWRLKAVVASVLLAACGYLLVSAWTGWRSVLGGLEAVGARGIALALGLSALNYGLRFVRWNAYMRAMGHRIPWGDHARIYLTGFALTTTPGKAGEAIRAVFLTRHGVDYGTTLAAMFSERLSDLVGVLVLCLPGLGLDARLHAWVVVAAAAVIGALALLAWPGWLAWSSKVTTQLPGRVGQLLRHAVDMLQQARRCHAPRLLVLATLLSLGAWSAEALAFHWICARLGVPISMGYAMFVYAASIIAGSLSLLPGGLGGTEAVMVALLLVRGSSMPDAVTATLLIRLATLWFAVALGMVALAGLRETRVDPA